MYFIHTRNDLKYFVDHSIFGLKFKFPKPSTYKEIHKLCNDPIKIMQLLFETFFIKTPN